MFAQEYEQESEREERREITSRQARLQRAEEPRRGAAARRRDLLDVVLAVASGEGPVSYFELVCRKGDINECMHEKHDCLWP